MLSIQKLKNLKIDSAKIPLRWMLVIPFVLLTTGATALVGYLSYQAGQQAVKNLADQLLHQTSERVSDRLSSYLEAPQQIVAANQLAAKQEMLDLNNSEQLRQQLWQQMVLNPTLPANQFWRDRGIGIGYGRIRSKEEQAFASKVTGKSIPMEMLFFSDNRSNQRQFYFVNAQGQPQELVYTVKGDFSSLDWYEQAKAVGQQYWTPLSINRIFPVLQVMAVAPAYDSTGKFQGLFVSNYFLAEISRFLNSLQFSPGGQVFIVERSGNLIATSEPTEATATVKVNGKPTRLAAIDSKNPVIRDVSQQLLQQFDSLLGTQDDRQFSLIVQGQRQFVQVVPYRDRYGLDWLMVMTIPESDFIGQIQAQKAWITLLCLGTLAATTALGILAAHRITAPLERLTLAADRIAQNQFEHEVPVTGLGEVKQLSQGFRQMAEQLHLSFQLRTDYEQELREQVARRTTELAQARDLREAIFNESTDAIFLVEPPPKTHILDCNQRAVELFEAKSKTDLIGIRGATLQKQPYTEEELAEIAAELEQQGFWSREIEYVTKTGRSFWGNLAVKPISVAGQAIQLVRLTDISDRKQLELALQESESRTKDILNSVIAGIARMRVFENGAWVIDQVSAGTELLCGYSADALTQDNHLWLSLIDPEDWKANATQLFTYIFAGKTYTYEYRLRHKDGHLRWISQTNSSSWDEVQQCWNLTAISVDITDRKRVEEERKQATEALQQSEARLQHLATHVPGVLYTVVFPPDGSPYFEYVSAAVEEIHELTQAQAYADFGLIYSQFHPEDIADYDAIANYCTANLLPFAYEWRIVTPSGKLKWLYAEALLEQRDNGDVVSHGIVQEITDRKQIELALQQKTEELDRFFTVALDLLCIGDTNGYFRRLNRQWEDTLGYSLEELEGSRFLDFVHPEDLDRTLAELAFLEEQQVSSLNFVNRYRCRDGSYRWIEWRSFPVGELVYAAARDITDRRQAELSLRRSERKFRGAFDTITTGMALVSLAGGFQEVNASLCQMLGYSAAELLALRLQDIVHPEDQQLGLVSLEQMIAGDIPGYQVEKRFVRQDGQSIWGLLNVALMRDTDDRPLYLIAQIIDMSERHRLDVIKDEFISVVSHELRTPLTSIRGSLGILNTGVLNDEPETAQQMLNLALRSTDRLVRLVNDILDLERLESGKAVLVREVCEVNDLMEQAIDSVQMLANPDNIHLNWTSLAAQVKADPDAIVQTLTNLLSNAIKFSPAGGTIWLRAELQEVGEQGSREQETGEQESRGAGENHQLDHLLNHSSIHPCTHPPIHSYVLFSIKDEGRGIPPEKLESIFGRFQQVDSSDSRQKGGTGLGLAICRSIVQQHGGEIWAESVVGQGSTFYFTLPATLEQ